MIQNTAHFHLQWCRFPARKIQENPLPHISMALLVVLDWKYTTHDTCTTQAGLRESMDRQDANEVVSPLAQWNKPTRIHTYPTLTWLLFSSKFQKWPWQSTQGFTFLSWNHWHLTNIMVEHNPLEESTSFILMKHFVFFITFAKIADWIDTEVNLKSQKNVKKWSYENFFCTFFNDNKILNSIISERFFWIICIIKKKQKQM